MNIADYRTLIFDCDGVILNSNKVKTEAFYRAALPYGENEAEILVKYHVARGGISRQNKFEWFLEEVVKGRAGPSLSQLLLAFSEEVKTGLLSCEVAEGIEELRKQTPHATWLVVSGGDQQELREVFKQRDLGRLFNGGIFGGPDSKEVILTREIEIGNIHEPAIFLGDSEYDYHAAIAHHLDFLFIEAWSEFSELTTFSRQRNIGVCQSLSDLLQFS